jgi:hypothetical protein
VDEIEAQICINCVDRSDEEKRVPIGRRTPTASAARLLAAPEWLAERRLKESPIVRKSAPGVLYRDVAPAENRAGENALQCTQPVTSPAPSIDEEYQAGWDRWLRGHLDIERENLIEAIGGALAARRNELLDRIEPRLEKQLGKIAALELKLAELTGAVAVLRGKEPPPPAKFPRVKAWTEDTIYHEGDIVAFAGGTFQARRDMASPPGAKGWVCLAKPGNSLTVRGTYSGDIDYRCLDVAMIGGSSFVALTNNPGVCPGDDWQPLCSRGATYSAIPILADGSAGPALELRPLFEHFVSEREAGGGRAA